MTSICVDAFNLALPKGTGIATYTRNLLANTHALGMENHALYGPASLRTPNAIQNEMALVDLPTSSAKRGRFELWAATYASRWGTMAYSTPRTGAVVWPSTSAAEHIDHLWSAPHLFRTAIRSYRKYGTPTPVSFDTSDLPPPDIVQWTSALPLYSKKSVNIYTIHDLIPLKLPYVTADDKSSFLKLCQFIAKKADHIITVSESARSDIIQLLGVDEGRVTNTYQSIEAPTAPRKSHHEIGYILDDSFGLSPGEYYLYFGAIEPKKNVLRLIEAYIASRSERPLLIVGGRGWLDDDEEAFIRQIHRDGGSLAQRIRRYEYLPRSLLTDLIFGARATVFPSLYEGFGLPVLESMAMGTAVMTSQSGALREISGDAALGVNPYDVTSIAEGFQRLENDDDLVESLGSRGALRANSFSPERYQERLKALYSKLT